MSFSTLKTLIHMQCTIWIHDLSLLYTSQLLAMYLTTRMVFVGPLVRRLMHWLFIYLFIFSCLPWQSVHGYMRRIVIHIHSSGYHSLSLRPTLFPDNGLGV